MANLNVMEQKDPTYILDMKPPKNTLLSARYKQSFAYKTMRIRLPAILLKITADIAKESEDTISKYGEAVRSDIECNVEKILKLRSDIQNDSVLNTFQGNEGDKLLWNDFLQSLDSDSNTYFKACWLYAECYVYRRLYSFFENHKTLRTYDYFFQNKRNAFIISVDAMIQILNDLQYMATHISDDNLKQLLKLNLWSNRCDLSISSGQVVKLGDNPFELVKIFDANIIVDQCAQIIECLKTAAEHQQNPVIVEIICDNAGYELFTDFVLADYLIESKLASAVRFNFKAIPWFISDVTLNDFRWSLQFMVDHASPALRDYGKKWQKFIVEDKFQVAETDYFWTSPFEYYRMAEINPELYSRLSKAHLVIFKGDLNYRKLLGDFSWDYTTPLTTCLRGFLPTNICSLRTVKADLICGLADGQAEKLEKESKDWMITGEYGTIQFASK